MNNIIFGFDKDRVASSRTTDRTEIDDTRTYLYDDDIKQFTKTVNCSIPLETSSFNINIDKQDRNVYDYHNVTRLAAIFNNVHLKITEHKTVDEIFKIFTDRIRASEVIEVFLNNFEEIFLKYIRCKYTTIDNIVFNDIDVPLYSHLPIHCWYSNTILFVTYTSKYLNTLMKNVSSLLFAYGEDSILDACKIDGNDNCLKLIDSNKVANINHEMNKTIEMISSRIASENFGNCSMLDNNFYLMEEKTTLESLVTNNLQIMNSLNKTDDELCPNNSKYILKNVFKIQQNISKIYTKQNFSCLTFLHAVYYVLDSVTQSITTKIVLGDDKKEAKKTNIHVNFKTGTSTSDYFIHDKVTIKNPNN